MELKHVKSSEKHQLEAQMTKYEHWLLPAGWVGGLESRNMNNHYRIVEEQRKKRLCEEKDNRTVEEANTLKIIRNNWTLENWITRDTEVLRRIRM